MLVPICLVNYFLMVIKPHLSIILAQVHAGLWWDSSYEQMVSINILNDQPSNSTCIIIYEGPTAGLVFNMYIYDSHRALLVCVWSKAWECSATCQKLYGWQGGNTICKLGKLLDSNLFTWLCLCLFNMSHGQVSPIINSITFDLNSWSAVGYRYVLSMSEANDCILYLTFVIMC